MLMVLAVLNSQTKGEAPNSQAINFGGTHKRSDRRKFALILCAPQFLHQFVRLLRENNAEYMHLYLEILLLGSGASLFCLHVNSASG